MSRLARLKSVIVNESLSRAKVGTKGVPLDKYLNTLIKRIQERSSNEERWFNDLKRAMNGKATNPVTLTGNVKTRNKWDKCMLYNGSDDEVIEDLVHAPFHTDVIWDHIMGKDVPEELVRDDSGVPDFSIEVSYLPTENIVFIRDYEDVYSSKDDYTLTTISLDGRFKSLDEILEYLEDNYDLIGRY